jgi:hypothetical protein
MSQTQSADISRACAATSSGPVLAMAVCNQGQGKAAMDKTLRFGIEIETVGVSRATLAQAIHEVVGGHVFGTSVRATDGRVWNVVNDGSLSGVYNGEVVSPILTYDDLPQLQSIVRALRRAGAVANSSCGIHLHVDGSRLDSKAITNLVKMVAKQERILEQALGVSDSRLRQYCRPVSDELLAVIEARRPRTTAAMQRLWYGTHGGSPSRYDRSRYSGLNLNSLFFRGTIEFRWFAFSGSTLHAGEVKAYVQFVLALVSAAARRRATSGRRRAYMTSSARYDMRVFLLGLGMIGEEFETARHHLLKRLPGSAAWKNGRPTRRAAAAAPADPDADENPEGGVALCATAATTPPS